MFRHEFLLLTLKGNSVKKSIITISLAAAIAIAAPLTMTGAGVTHGYQQSQAATSEASAGMKRVTLIIKKLRDAMGSMKDFDELEKAGLRKKDVDRMRRAMDTKIQQMMEDAIYAIRSI